MLVAHVTKKLIMSHIWDPCCYAFNVLFWTAATFSTKSFSPWPSLLQLSFRNSVVCDKMQSFFRVFGFWVSVSRTDIFFAYFHFMPLRRSLSRLLLRPWVVLSPRKLFKVALLRNAPCVACAHPLYSSTTPAGCSRDAFVGVSTPPLEVKWLQTWLCSSCH